ncbi:carboxylesterase family protein [Streptomyces sp. SM11]|uniref:carboxylesterase family protein n=1 Tax=Streptomyces sp. SM11 TaxID=565557 RepID=UPI000CD53FD7|nr:carboxylesterase family protein [Streptomyces sp. SM11]
MPDVSAPSGRWRGRASEGVTTFHGIPYGNAGRFGRPGRPKARNEVADATRPGPVAPQLPSRLEGVIGPPSRLEQSEDCQTLTITVRQDARAGGSPVLVWLHGGAYVSGSGEWAQYGAERLVRETGIVVVSVSYRLGALGYLFAPEVSPGNLGLLDQIAALEWVRDNVEAFGGDPGRVTAAGQSAGAHSITAMLGIDRAAPLFARAIVQSAPLGLGFHTPQQARRVAGLFLKELGGDPRRAPVADVLAAQARVTRRLAGPGGLRSRPPFLPSFGAEPMPEAGRWRQNVLRDAAGRQFLIGNTVDEMTAFHGPHPTLARIRRIPVAGPAAAKAFRRLAQDRVFDQPVRALAGLLAGAGAPVWCYEVRSPHSGSPFGACHCIDLPLLFGDEDAWSDAPMLRPLSPREISAIGARTRAHWGHFVHTGRISDPVWPAHWPSSQHRHPLP